AARLPGIVKDGQPRSVRAHDGWQFALAVVAGGAAAFLLAGWAVRRELPGAPARRLVRGTTLAAAAASVVAVVALAVHEGGPGPLAHKAVNQFTNTPQQQIGQGGARLGSLNSSNRWS